MTDPESATVPPRLDPGLAGDKGPTTIPRPHSNAYAGPIPHSASMSQFGAPPRGAAFETRLFAADDDAPRFRASTSGGNLRTRDHAVAAGSGDSQPTGHPSSSTSDHRHPSENSYPPQLPNRHPLALSRSNSQGTSSTNGADPVFTPPASGGRVSPGSGSAHGSSQESQLHQLSQIAAAQARIPEDADMGHGASRKRMADGVVKHTRDKSNVSPGQMVGHSRNTSTVSVASTAGSRIGELSAELKARLSYAMVKVNHGWQAHSIDQVETLASQAASPASSASTIHLRNGSSASPQLSAASHRASNNTTPATGPHHQHPGRPGDSQWRTSPQSTSRGSSASPVKTSHGLAPPVSIQPSQHAGNPRREPNPRHVPSFLSSSHHTSPHAGGLHTSPYLPPGRHRSAMSEAMLVSPHTNVREQDAIESLLFMSSPGNSANLKHAFPTSASQPLPSSHGHGHGHAAPPPPTTTTTQRTALPTSQPRKSLPSGRPPHHARSQSHSQPHTLKRVNFEKSPSAMDIDEPAFTGGSPMSVTRGTPRRRMNGEVHPHPHQAHAAHGHVPTPRLKQLPVSAGLTVSSKPRQALADDEIDRMLDRAAAVDGDSDSEGEIELPGVGVGRGRRDGVGVVGV
ncbi:hypothetical protein C8A01DRAFT_35299 [Parachaetomium inaequale]|uniref:Cyclin-dependent kinase n=1 Tax=Parachaetomium inaequale TaxID=2588326 RepID=A0AAN6PGV9_9PEZI|nr:hypothetical protein C8A01DRAFT_35299 [Parachaetomium inaequale]